jgi:hypothetical protein
MGVVGNETLVEILEGRKEGPGKIIGARVHPKRTTYQSVRHHSKYACKKRCSRIIRQSYCVVSNYGMCVEMRLWEEVVEGKREGTGIQ